MSEIKHLQFSKLIAAPPSRVYQTMTAPDSYRDWTSAFFDGSYYEGSWEEGERIRFLAPTGEGMVAEIAENRENEYISVRHLGFIANGVEDTESESVKAWAPAYENYTFESVPEGTRLVIDQDVTADAEASMAASWSKALDRLKALCEDPARQ